ncbi:MAG: class I SAM-dependent methyltransferase [Planctomycetota bacterium]
MNTRRAPKLDNRLQQLIEMICEWTPRGSVHLDIGSDHGGLLQELLRRSHVARGIAVEINEQPFQNSCQQLAGSPVDVRRGDGLQVVASGEMESLSISGMGGRTMTQVLSTGEEKLCDALFLQPNKDVHRVRQWAYERRWQLVEERLTHDLFVLLAFCRSNEMDPVYEGIPAEVAFHFGPRLLREQCPVLRARLEEESSYYMALASVSESARARCTLLDHALSAFDGQSSDAPA